MPVTCSPLAHLCCGALRRPAGQQDDIPKTRSSTTTSSSGITSSDSHPQDATVQNSAPPKDLPKMTREKVPTGASRSSSGRHNSGDIFKLTRSLSAEKSSLSKASSVVAELELGDISHPANNLTEASSRRLADIECKREEDRKKTQRHVVSKFIKATAAAIQDENKNYANDPAVASLLHDEIVLITYDKMKFYGRKMVQKKINTGMEQMLSLISHMSSTSKYLTGDDAEMKGPADGEKTEGKGGGVIDIAASATAGDADEPAIIDVPNELAPGLKVDGPNEVPGKDGMWAVTYSWKHGKTTVDFQETFTIVDYKIKKLKRGRS